MLACFALACLFVVIIVVCCVECGFWIMFGVVIGCLCFGYLSVFRLISFNCFVVHLVLFACLLVVC